MIRNAVLVGIFGLNVYQALVRSEILNSITATLAECWRDAEFDMWDEVA